MPKGHTFAVLLTHSIPTEHGPVHRDVVESNKVPIGQSYVTPILSKLQAAAPAKGQAVQLVEPKAADCFAGHAVAEL